jgi:hypothetical protein
MEMVKIQPTVMNMSAFKKGLSPFACTHCGAHSSKGMEIQMRKAHNAWVKNPALSCDCGELISVIDSKLTILPSSASLLDETNVKATTWFHATDVYNWLEEVSFDYGEEDEDMLRPYVHLGSKEAALELAKWKYLEGSNDGDEMFYLWQVTLNMEAILADSILEDNNDWFYEVTGDTREAMGADAVRYLNKWESAGSISLLADPRYLTMVRVDEVDSNNYFDVLEGKEISTAA